MYSEKNKIKWSLWSLAFGLFFIFLADTVFAERLSVSASIANIRSGPGTKYEVLWKVEKYHPIVVIKKSGSWYYFSDFEKDEGWIHNSLTADTPAVITKKEKCNVRSGPGTKYSVLLTIGNGIPFKKLKKQGQWINIMHADGDRGWIHESLVW